MKYQYYICDVFTETRFGGNQLAVLPKAEGLTPEQMQRITREFNFSETAFVFAAEAGHTRRVRIFTPASEIPFAGHPNVGTAFVLANNGEFGEINAPHTVTFEEEAGLVSVTIHAAEGKIVSCELAAPQPLSLGDAVEPELVASAVSLNRDDIITDTHNPQVCSVGLPFVFTELRDRAALERARINMDGFERLRNVGVDPQLYLYTRANESELARASLRRDGQSFDIRARMFAPLSGVPEDPATGSANCTLGGLLAHHEQVTSGMFSWRIAQGVEMGRPSTLKARAEKKEGVVTGMWIGGASVLVSEGTIEVDWE
jgi:trans-2,3-dihydro-3-hydroxyanthranilate isomerase